MAAGGRKNTDDALILALAAGQTVAEAARSAKLSERTAYRRLAEEGFAEQVREARSRLFSQTLGRLLEANTAAVNTLRALLDAASEMARLGAARSILELCLKVRQTTETDARLAEVERLLASMSAVKGAKQR